MPDPVMNLASPSQVTVGGILGKAMDASLQGRLTHFVRGPASDAIAIFSPDAVGRNFAGGWNGEHAGKWLYAAARAAARTGDSELVGSVRAVADYLVSRQEPGGYLGTYASTSALRMTAYDPGVAPTWDVWVHSYIILGLLEANRYFPDGTCQVR